MPLSPNVVKRCIRIRRQKKIKTPDAIIAATAIEHDYILLTSDTDFKNIPHLQVLDPARRSVPLRRLKRKAPALLIKNLRSIFSFPFISCFTKLRFVANGDATLSREKSSV